ncbi:unnamed protein product [Microthlaspi erraticum]|uniref:Arabidopsis retrotransposon Orf1 C-terminal domain-containing protein n=1 Tax=Microthlaspi erraticum TaxID=1685480 RepID=A0A6D2L271_9BRAS|nr:unnamed protein product [Microthlaspi erraticum]
MTRESLPRFSKREMMCSLQLKAQAIPWEAEVSLVRTIQGQGSVALWSHHPSEQQWSRVHGWSKRELRVSRGVGNGQFYQGHCLSQCKDNCPINSFDSNLSLTGYNGKNEVHNKPVQSEDVERAREEKREGKKKMEYSGKRKKGAVKESAPKWPETAGQEWTTHDPRPYGVQERIRILRRMQFMSMRYPHPETIKELGIEEDVNDILYYTELGEFTKLALPAYREPAMSSSRP